MTKRHGQNKIANGATKASPKAKSEFHIAVSKIDELAACFTNRLEDTTETHCGADARHIVEALGKNSKNSLNELLHLVTKAQELEDEKKSYLAELAVVNRGRVSTPKHVPFEDLGKRADANKGSMSPHQAASVDLTVPDDSRLIGKRKAVSASELVASELTVDEHKEKKSKKRKKDKKEKRQKETEEAPKEKAQRSAR